MTSDPTGSLAQIQHWRNSQTELSDNSELFSIGNRPALETLLSCWELLDGRVRLILRQDARLLAASIGAPEFFDRNSALRVNGDMVHANPRHAHENLMKLISVAPGETETMIIHNDDGGRNCVLSATHLFPNAVAVMITNADEQVTPVFADLEEALGLTPSEVHVVEMLMGGQTPPRIAERLGISIHTVRAHLRHCYDKLGISSREELWRKVAPLRLN